MNFLILVLRCRPSVAGGVLGTLFFRVSYGKLLFLESTTPRVRYWKLDI
jgi:hypothetical protein